MFHHKKLKAWQRLVLALRDISAMARCSMQCPGGCGPVQGDERSWWCPKCGGAGSSG